MKKIISGFALFGFQLAAHAAPIYCSAFGNAYELNLNSRWTEATVLIDGKTASNGEMNCQVSKSSLIEQSCRSIGTNQGHYASVRSVKRSLINFQADILHWTPSGKIRHVTTLECDFSRAIH